MIVLWYAWNVFRYLLINMIIMIVNMLIMIVVVIIIIFDYAMAGMQFIKPP